MCQAIPLKKFKINFKVVFSTLKAEGNETFGWIENIIQDQISNWISLQNQDRFSCFF